MVHKTEESVTKACQGPQAGAARVPLCDLPRVRTPPGSPPFASRSLPAMRRVAACILATCVLAAMLGRGQAAVKAYTPASWSAAVRL